MHGWQDQETASSGPPLMKLSLYALGHVVRQGHTLELSLMAPSPLFQPDWGPLPLSLPSLNRVYHSAEYPSSLTLPIVPGAKAQAPPPPCGSLQFQPCRFAPKPTRSTGRQRRHDSDQGRAGTDR